MGGEGEREREREELSERIGGEFPKMEGVVAAAAQRGEEEKREISGKAGGELGRRGGSRVR